MSGIKSDNWIRSKCGVPVVYVTVDASGNISPLSLIHSQSAAEVYAEKTGQTVRLATPEECFSSLFLTRTLPMIHPFEPNQVRVKDTEAKERAISYGTSSYGYDIRCSPEFKVFTNVHSAVVDPKNFDDKSFVDMAGESCVIPPNSFALARSVEYFRIPRDILVICLGKSTYARCGIIVNVTPLEPEWEGHITLEFSNTTPLPARIYANEGCAQLLFLQADGDDVCTTSYADRSGKYQGQTGVTLPRG